MALNKAEILSEMESLVVLGGKDDGKGDSYSKKKIEKENC